MSDEIVIQTEDTRAYWTMAKQLTDDEQNLKRKARRRLIGAIALTLAVVVILPMVLESEPKPTGQDIDLRIPAPDKVGEFVPGVAASEVAAAPTAISSAVQVSVPVAVQTEPVHPAVVPAPAAVSAGKVAVTAKPEANVKTSASTNKLSEARVNEAKASGSKKNDASTADKHGEVESASAENHVVQVGAYANADTAKQELSKLKKWGFKAYTEKAGEKIRVRVGPYAQREKAEKVRQLLEKHGLHPVITNAQ